MGKILTVGQFKTRILLGLFLSGLAAGIALCYAGNKSGNERFLILGFMCFMAVSMTLFVSVILWAMRHQLDKGIKYVWKHYKLVRLIERQLLDAGIYTTVKIGDSKLAKIPWVAIQFEKNYQRGTVYIRNSIKFHGRWSKMDISASLGSYVVEQVYLTDNENHYCYDFYDSAIERRMVFENFEAFKSYAASLNPYELFIDKYSKFRLAHQLLVGQTGSGKTYALHGYVLQMLLKPIKYHLYFADPKSSSLALLGGQVSPETTADSFNGIVRLLESFVAEMEKRQLQLKNLLRNKIDGDYRDFGLPPYVLLFDEYADFATFLQTKDKKQRDYVNNLISQIVLKGRQSGFFLWVVMQQAGSNNIPTYVRDNLPWKVVLGNAEDQTYVTAFGAGTDIPLRKLETGEGVFTYPAVANKPRLCSFPTFGFDVLGVLEAGVM